jgi:polar amino acid transport system permease protein
MESLIQNFFNLQIYRDALPYLLSGLWTTVWLSALVIPIGMVAGLLLAIGLTQARSKLVAAAIIAYIDFFRSFPPLVLLILVYFGWPFLGVELNKLTAVVIAFGLNNASYYAEVMRAGLKSVPAGQMEAARSTGLTNRQALWYVVVPQGVRNVVPDLVGNSIEVVKLTTIASVVALPELLHAAREVQSIAFNPSPIILAALLYLLLLLPLTRWLGRMEHKRHS